MAALKTAKQLASHFGVSASTIAYWRDQGAPIILGANNDPKKIKAWKEDWEARRAKPPPAQAAGRMAEAIAQFRLRDLAAKAKLAELKLQKTEGRLIPVEEAASTVDRLTAAVRQTLLAAPKTFAERFVGLPDAAEAEKRLHAVAVEVIETLRRAADDGGG